MIRVDWLITGLNVFGGAEVYATKLASHLATEDIQLRVITLRSGGSLISTLRNNGIPVIEIGLNSKINPIPLIHLINTWRLSPPDILHTHLFHAGVIGRLLARQTGIRRVVVHQHGTENNRSTLRSAIDKITSGMVDCYVVPSIAVKEMLKKREHITETKIHLIYYGIDPQLQNSSLPVSNWPAPPNVPVIGCVARLVPEKSHPVLLNALQILKQQGVKFHAIMIGDGPERNHLLRLTLQYEIGNNVSWVGVQLNVASWLSRFDLFVLPSSWEGLPLSVLEAMEARLPVVATSVGGTPEAVLANQTGILVPPGDPIILSKALSQLLLDPSSRLQMGNAAQTLVREQFSMTSAVNNMVNLYYQLLDLS